MINKGDKIISMLLLNSHESDMTYQRPDSSTYVCQIRKNKDNTFYTPETQLELSLDLPKPPQLTKLIDPPYKDTLKKYYGDNWEFRSNPNLSPHEI